MQQDIHSIAGGRFDRRLRPHGHHQALKCPRCDSLNTKFCYYNNYNLSQPRHFCKNCRRYWTKGGVLRNVPVGGGCRKSKRSKQKSDRKSNQSSSSDSSSLTAAAATTTAPPPAPPPPVAAAEEPGVPDQPSTNSTTAAFNLPDPSRFFNPPALDQQEPNSQMFGSFTSMMTSQEEMLGFGMGNRGSELKGRSDDGLAAALEWGDGGGVGGGGGGGDEGLFDLTGGIDSGSYWSQTEWTDNDQSLNNYLP